jgi:hypothetical protein
MMYSILQPILVFMSKVDGKFQFSPISVNFLTEVTKVIFAIIMLIIQVSLLSLNTHTLHKGICFGFLGWLSCFCKTTLLRL